MDMRSTNEFGLPESNVTLAKKCLALIRDIAARGACSDESEFIAYAVQELSQVMIERTGNSDRVFEPTTAEGITDLEKLHEELEWVDSFSQSMAASAQNAWVFNIPRGPFMPN